MSRVARIRALLREMSSRIWWRIHPREFTEEDLVVDHESRLWFNDDDSTTRRGLSVTRSYDDLVRYFVGDATTSVGRGARYDGAHLVQLEGERSVDRPYEEHLGEELIVPTAVLSSVPVERTSFIDDVVTEIQSRADLDERAVYDPLHDEIVILHEDPTWDEDEDDPSERWVPVDSKLGWSSEDVAERRRLAALVGE